MTCPDCKCQMIIFTNDFAPTIYKCPKCRIEIEEDEDSTSDMVDDRPESD